MTDRLKGVWVTFDQDIRTDDAESLINAIKHLRGVLAVEPNITDVADYMARERVRTELSEKLWEVLHPKKKTDR
jgi:hypothetical protein